MIIAKQQENTMKDIMEIVKQLSYKDSSKRIDAAETLGMIVDEKAVDALIPVLKDKDRFVRQEVAIALGKIGNPRRWNILLKLSKMKSMNP